MSSLVSGLPQLRDPDSLIGEAHRVVVMHRGTERTVSVEERAAIAALACEVMWPVLTYPARDGAELVARERGPVA
jgi:hypothetical protein